MEPAEVVVEFMARINERDAGGMAELMADDHVFVDAAGARIESRDAVLEAWRGYFAFCPEYWVTPDEVLADGDMVAVFGSAGGVLAPAQGQAEGNQWSTPASWFASVHSAKIKEWRAYADQTPVWKAINPPRETAGS
jgi:uncharacterized protein (TIGR02246 family)